MRPRYKNQEDHSVCIGPLCSSLSIPPTQFTHWRCCYRTTNADCWLTTEAFADLILHRSKWKSVFVKDRVCERDYNKLFINKQNPSIWGKSYQKALKYLKKQKNDDLSTRLKNLEENFANFEEQLQLIIHELCINMKTLEHVTNQEESLHELSAKVKLLELAQIPPPSIQHGVKRRKKQITFTCEQCGKHEEKKEMAFINGRLPKHGRCKKCDETYTTENENC